MMHISAPVTLPADGMKLRELSGRHWFVLFAASLLNLIDGFDIAAVAFAAGGIEAKWGLSPFELGIVLASAQFGSMIGALSLSRSSDRFGRRRMLVFACALTGTAMLLAAFAQNVWVFIALRTVSGIGVGLLGPLIVGYGTEFMPPSVRGLMGAIIVGSLPVGSVVGGILAASLIPVYGWEIIFIVGGVAPILMIPVMLRLPPSLVDLARARDFDRASELAALYEVEEPARDLERRSATSILFGDKVYRVTFFTVALTIFLAASVAHFLNTWLPRIVELNGGTHTIAALSASSSHLAGLIGCIGLGMLMDRFKPYRVSAVALAMGAIPVVMLGYVEPDTTILVAAFVAGFFILGGANSCNTFSTVSFPSEIRVAVISYTTVVARIGGVLAPTLAGFIMTLGGGPRTLFAACAVLLVAAALVMGLGGRFSERRARVAPIPAEGSACAAAE